MEVGWGWGGGGVVLFFFFKQKTAYEIGTGDWSSDVCSSDLFRLDEADNILGHAPHIIDFAAVNLWPVGGRGGDVKP